MLYSLHTVRYTSDWTQMTETMVDRSDAVTSREGAHHQSSLETILDGCSFQYYLGNVKGIPQPPKPHSVVGVAFHSAVELHEQARIDGTPLPSMIDMVDYAVNLVEAEADDIPPAMMVGKKGEPWNTGTLTEMVSSAVENWYSAKLKDGGIPHREWLLDLEPVAIEPYFRMDLVDGTFPIGGWIDGVYRNKDDHILVVDQKTAGDFSRWPEDGSGHRNQATMYTVAILLSPDFPEVTVYDIEMHYLVSRTRVGNVERARRVMVKPDFGDVAYMGKRIRQAQHIIDTHDYVPNPAWNLCSPRFCPFYEGCQVTGELRKVPDKFLEKYKEV